jgi:hypothetical protein
MITTSSLPLTEVPTCYYFFKTLSRKFSASILSTSRAPGALHSIALSKFSRNNHGTQSFPTGTEKFKRSNQTQTSPRDDEIPCQSLYRRSTHPVLVNTPSLYRFAHHRQPVISSFNQSESHSPLTTFTVPFPLGRANTTLPTSPWKFFFHISDTLYLKALTNNHLQHLHFFNYHHSHSKHPLLT